MAAERNQTPATHPLALTNKQLARDMSTLRGDRSCT